MSTLPTLVSESFIKRAKKLNTTLLADALEFTGAMDYRIKPVSPGMKMVGTAITVNMAPGDNLFLHEAIHLSKKGYIIVADGKGHKSNAYLGELMTRAAKAREIEGIVIDGLVRDLKGLSDLRFPIFAKGLIPNGPFKNGPGEIGGPISCGNVNVNSGDLVLGDEDGVTIVPREKIEFALDEAEKEVVYEIERIKKISEFEERQKQGIEGEGIEPSWIKKM